MSTNSKSSEESDGRFDMKGAVEAVKGAIEITNMVIFFLRTVKTEVDDWNARPKKAKKAKKTKKAKRARMAAMEKRLDLMEKGQATNVVQILPYRRIARTQIKRGNVKRREAK